MIILRGNWRICNNMQDFRVDVSKLNSPPEYVFLGVSWVTINDGGSKKHQWYFDLAQHYRTLRNEIRLQKLLWCRQWAKFGKLRFWGKSWLLHIGSYIFPFWIYPKPIRFKLTPSHRPVGDCLRCNRNHQSVFSDHLKSVMYRRCVNIFLSSSHWWVGSRLSKPRKPQNWIMSKSREMILKI